VSKDGDNEGAADRVVFQRSKMGRRRVYARAILWREESTRPESGGNVPKPHERNKRVDLAAKEGILPGGPQTGGF